MVSEKGRQASVLVQKVWSYAHILKDDGLAFMDYTEQITYLLFLKMAWEHDSSSARHIPAEYGWGTLRGIADQAKLMTRYHEGLKRLSEKPGLVGLIFTKPQSKISDPAKLQLLIQMIDGERWSSLDVDVKGEVYEGLLARNAEDVRGGAGQYFTPRPVTRAVVEVMRPTTKMKIADPACGTGGFLLAAFEYLKDKAVSAGDARHLRSGALKGVELVANVARLCAMNLYLHGIGVGQRQPMVRIGDSLEGSERSVDMVLTNPPFGRKSSVTIVGRDGKKQTDRILYTRPDFWVTTSNKQLSFVQHVYTMLKEGGRAAVVVPDNVLFEGGAGEKVRRELLERCRVHTLLRLPTGIWYSPGVKANVLFFDRESTAGRPATEELWIYDLRSKGSFSLKQNPIGAEDLADFVHCYRAEDPARREETPVFKRFSYATMAGREKTNMDLWWQQGGVEGCEGRNPRDVMKEIVEDLSEAMREFAAAESELED